MTLALLLLAFCFDQGPDCHGTPEPDPLHFEIQTAWLVPPAPVSCEICDETGCCGPSLCPGASSLSPFQREASLDALAGPSICTSWMPVDPDLGEVIFVRVMATDLAGNVSWAVCP